VRTTIVLEDTLLRRAKQRAARSGISLSELVERALRDALRAPVTSPEPFRMPVHGVGAARASHEPADFTSELLDEDATALGR
jgi:hypothetical protein